MSTPGTTASAAAIAGGLPPLALATLGDDFTLAGRHFDAKVVDIYDGDTLRAVVELWGHHVQFRFRLAGLDTPEMKPLKADPTRSLQKIAAASARDALARKIGHGLVRIACGEFDLHGRILARLSTLAGEDINAWLITAGYAVPYDGISARAPWTLARLEAYPVHL